MVWSRECAGGTAWRWVTIRSAVRKAVYFIPWNMKEVSVCCCESAEKTAKGWSYPQAEQDCRGCLIIVESWKCMVEECSRCVRVIGTLRDLEEMMQ